jgi:hypothetical protein
MKTRKTLVFLLPLLAVSLPVLLALASRSDPERTSQLAHGDGAPSVGAALLPKAIVEQATYNFGVLDPLTESTHSFTIRNDGAAPLELTAGSTTCKCTLSEITHPVIQPGESGQVRLVWNTGSKYTFYSHGATIHTNDPLHKELDLRIQGTVRVRLGAVNPELLFDGVEPDSPKSVSTWIYSQMWDSFEIEQVECSRADIQWKFESVDLSRTPDIEAKSARRITVTVPAGMPEGHFSEVLTCLARRDNGDTESLELTLVGKVLRRLSLYGPGIDHLGHLDLGNATEGEELNRRLVLKVRDPQSELKVLALEAEPKFLDVQLTPYQTESKATGLYHLDIRLPRDVAPADYRGARRGRITLSVDHPRIEDLEIPVSFAVLAGR